MKDQEVKVPSWKGTIKKNLRVVCVGLEGTVTETWIGDGNKLTIWASPGQLVRLLDNFRQALPIVGRRWTSIQRTQSRKSGSKATLPVPFFVQVPTWAALRLFSPLCIMLSGWSLGSRCFNFSEALIKSTRDSTKKYTVLACSHWVQCHNWATMTRVLASK